MNQAAKNSSDAVPSLLRRMNTRRVLEALQTLGPSTRAELTRHTHISAPTMSKLTEQLLEAGLLEQDAKPQATRGRPGVVFRLAATRAQVIGAAIDVQSCTVATSGLDGIIEPKTVIRFKTPRTSATLLDKLEAACTELQTQSDDSEFMGIGLSVPGLIDRNSGRIQLSPNLHFLDGENPGSELADRLDMPVKTFQEEHAFCQAARMFGKARHARNFVLIDISGGLGMGAVIDGHFLFGHNGFGGEIGHITVDPDGASCGCGNRGCLETVATDSALARLLSEQTGETLTMDDIVERVQAGQLDPQPALDKTLDFLAIGIAAAVNVFNPELVLLYGRMLDLKDGILDDLQARVRQRALQPSMFNCHIRRAEADKVRGAIAGIIQDVYSRTGPRMRH